MYVGIQSIDMAIYVVLLYVLSYIMEDSLNQIKIKSMLYILYFTSLVWYKRSEGGYFIPTATILRRR